MSAVDVERVALERRLANAERTIEKCQDVLRRCETHLGYQAQMNAALHMSDRVMYSPLHAAVESVLVGIEAYQEGQKP